MAKCDLTIHLEDEQEVYRPGDVVKGYVEVRADAEVQCNGLTVGCRWKTHGKGNADRGESISQDVFQGTWRAGAVQRYPFAIELPGGPYTYHGHYVNVAWEVHAQADIPWAFDPKAEREIVLEAHPEQPPEWLTAVGDSRMLPYDLQQTAKGEPIEEASRSSKRFGNILGLGCLLVVGVPMIIGLFVAGSYALRFAQGDLSADQGLPAVVFTLVLAAILGGLAVKLFRNLLARKKVGQVDFDLEPRLLRRGDETRIRLSCQPREETELVTATARLRAREKAVRGSGTNKRSFRHVVYEEETEIALGRTLQAGLPFRAEGTIKIPADAPPSFLGGSNRLQWTVALRLDIARWPDWEETRSIVVHP